jgi:hypothetical protein
MCIYVSMALFFHQAFPNVRGDSEFSVANLWSLSSFVMSYASVKTHTWIREFQTLT